MTGHLCIAEAILKDHEGFRSKPYQCTAGKLTVGYGRNLDDRGVSRDEALLMLANDIREAEADLASFSYWESLGDNQKAALVDMRFCLGFNRFRQFKLMNAALEAGDYQEAANQVLDSLFARQVKGRARDIAEMLVMDE